MLFHGWNSLSVLNFPNFSIGYFMTFIVKNNFTESVQSFMVSQKGFVSLLFEDSLIGIVEEKTSNPISWISLKTAQIHKHFHLSCL